jgi:hypothetical protein
MLKELEADAYNTLSPLDIMQVEGYFRQWNDIMKSSSQPVWQIYADQQGKTSEQFLQEKREASRGF